MSEKTKMLAGEPYNVDDELVSDLIACSKWLQEFNSLNMGAWPDAKRLLRHHLGSFGETSFLRAPFHCDYGFNIFIGEDVTINSGCTILDVARITIGESELLPVRWTRG